MSDDAIMSVTQALYQFWDFYWHQTSPMGPLSQADENQLATLGRHVEVVLAPHRKLRRALEGGGGRE
jgi:hypothetical protein